jgi:hypothetical protein
MVDTVASISYGAGTHTEENGMHYYRISAEHISRLDIGKAAREMESIPGVIMMACGRDHIFERHGQWVVASESDLGNQLQDIVWRYNGGAWCEQTTMSETEAEELC